VTGDGRRRRTTKVEKMIEKYDLQGIGPELEAYWVGDGRERKSLRDLAEQFNRRLLESALRDADASSFGFETENYYDILTNEGNTGVSVEVKSRLERNGVDADAVIEDFVTYQAIRNFLTDVRGASYEKPTDETQIDRDRAAIERLITRIENVASEKLTRLAKTGRVTLGDFRLFVSVDILCEGCDTQYQVVELLRRGGCECDEPLD
jgi:hypothetical protein